MNKDQKADQRRSTGVDVVDTIEVPWSFHGQC